MISAAMLEPNAALPGLISGRLSYPSGFLPPMRVAAGEAATDINPGEYLLSPTPGPSPKGEGR